MAIFASILIMNRKWLIWGSVFGLIAPYVGVFVGLQVSVVLGNILTFPLIILAALTDSVFGNWGLPFLLLATALSVVIWALIFGVVGLLLNQRSNKQLN